MASMILGSHQAGAVETGAGIQAAGGGIGEVSPPLSCATQDTKGAGNGALESARARRVRVLYQFSDHPMVCRREAWGAKKGWKDIAQ